MQKELKTVTRNEEGAIMVCTYDENDPIEKAMAEAYMKMADDKIKEIKQLKRLKKRLCPKQWFDSLLEEVDEELGNVDEEDEDEDENIEAGPASKELWKVTMWNIHAEVEEEYYNNYDSALNRAIKHAMESLTKEDLIDMYDIEYTSSFEDVIRDVIVDDGYIEETVSIEEVQILK